MKISKSKRQLAQIIRENGGWRDGAESAAQSKSDNAISFYRDTACRDGDCWWGSYILGADIAQSLLLPNWHQTVLSREEFDQIVAADKLPKHDVNCRCVTRFIPEPTTTPTLDQLLQDWRNADDYAQRKQTEADEAAAMRDERWQAVQARAGEMGVTVGRCESEQELVITDWRDLRVGDEVEAECHDGTCVGLVTDLEHPNYNGPRPIRFKPFGECERWCTSSNFRFIRRP